jgi:hypothetical protein
MDFVEETYEKNSGFLGVMVLVHPQKFLVLFVGLLSRMVAVIIPSELYNICGAGRTAL